MKQPRKSVVQFLREVTALPRTPMNKEDLVDLLFDVQVGNVSCRWAAQLIIDRGVTNNGNV